MHPARWSVLALAALPLLAHANTAPELLPGRDVELTFTDARPAGTKLPAGTTFPNAGSAGSGVVAAALYANGGSLKLATGRSAGDTAVRAPAHIATPTATPKSAVVRITNTGATDLLDPGTQAFSFGADFALDAASSTADSKDDGDNLIQRGLAGSATQWKIQIDRGIPSCVVKQGATTIQAKTTLPIDRGSWYRAVCRRTTSGATTTVVLTVTRLSTGAVVPSTPATGPLVDLSIATGVPMSVGGKLSDVGALILSATDQFNGKIDNAFLDLE